MSTIIVQPKSSPRELSRRMFFLAGYSLTGAALMGSSIGLVIYQSRQFYLLHRFSRSDEMHTHHHHHRHGRFRDHFNNNETFELDLGLNSSSDNDPSTHGQYLHSRFHGGHGHHRSLQSLFFSTWLPILVWFSSLLTSSFLIAARKWVPRAMSARTGVLVSQCVFAFFWILLGAMQEIQERLIAERRAARTMDDPIAAAMEDSNQFDVIFELKEQIRSMILPLCTVWYLTVILLGSATGLLTASSSLLEKQIQEEYDEAVFEQEEEEAVAELLAEEIEALTKEDTKQPLTILAQRQDSRKSNNAGGLTRYTTPQRVQLGLLMFVLFMTQMKLFQWIIQAQSMQAFIDGTDTSVSLTLTLVGFVSGTVMTSLGVRFLPRTTASSTSTFA
ncbi:hypothetical protein BG015_000743 [Linnemannia schmuckeri]|uniref:Uncharacterized protein n=1 Tax=Linnemannia schmuckeri TaxID=64567 RepID=A0A9P5VDN5_9FUNG|nr:hypothetical protein BG015_000743 [Linnemannia schmuckeri]